jgi:hypothetical protein
MLGNVCDNCVFVSNPNQADLDSDNRGDACDNCPSAYNPWQDDVDIDQAGDVCDNCPFTANTDQLNQDSDMLLQLRTSMGSAVLTSPPLPIQLSKTSGGPS